ncbi:MAG: DUF192 domain-containing protein [Bacteroidota bacterium]
MAKSSARKKTKQTAQKKKKKKSPKRNYRQMIISTLIILAVVAFVLPDLMPLFTGGSRGNASSSNPTIPTTTNPAAAMPEPSFTKEGELSIISSASGEVIHHLDIEKAENDEERALGMMFRRSMPDSRGMLFLFDEARPQSFWMKNTFIPLDIIYIDENKKITTIYANTTPHSETSLPSKGNAQFVLEVRGGFCQDYGVKVGDSVDWQ